MWKCWDLTLTSTTAWSADSIFSNVTNAQLGWGTKREKQGVHSHWGHTHRIADSFFFLQNALLNELEACLLTLGHVDKHMCRVWYQKVKALLRNGLISCLRTLRSNSMVWYGRNGPAYHKSEKYVLFWLVSRWWDPNFMMIGQHLLEKK